MNTCHKCGKDYTVDQNGSCRNCESEAKSPSYEHEWLIIVRADSKRGAMDAVNACWESWNRDNEPLGGSRPASMGHRMDYDVSKRKIVDIGETICRACQLIDGFKGWADSGEWSEWDEETRTELGKLLPLFSLPNSQAHPPAGSA